MLKILLIILPISIIGCTPITASDISVTNISAKEFYSSHFNLLFDKNTAVIDARSKEMFESGHLPNAKLIDARKDCARERIEEFLKYETLVLYCTTHKRSNLILSILEEKQYKGTLYFINNGIDAWIENNFPTVSPNIKNINQ